uniref:Fic family protein n=1 Tax=uncultured bacterium contig00092 TaxID=1181563 RepID=A0A806K2J2_9BACT|nr:fic family protein [uncultured bacterium contig00092]
MVVKERKKAYYKYLEFAQAESSCDLLSLFIAESIIAAGNVCRV